MTGGECLSGTEIADMLSSKLGRSVSHKDISLNEAQRILQNQRTIDQYEAKYLLEIYSCIKTGKCEFVTKDYMKVVGEEPTPLNVFIEKYKDEFLGTEAGVKEP